MYVTARHAVYAGLLLISAVIIGTHYYRITYISNQEISADVAVKGKTPQSGVPTSVEYLRRCIVDPRGNLSENFSLIINTCLARYSSITEDTKFLGFHMGRLGEIKYFLPFDRRPIAGEDCVWLTVGVGGEYQAEKEFKETYPNCRVFGIEPQPDQVPGFATYGTVIPKGVGTEEASLTMRVRIGNGHSSAYHFRKTSIEPLAKLLDEYVHARFVHFSTMDIEGFEYHLIRALQKGEKFDKEGIVFCQIDAELHSMDMTTSFEKTKNGFNDFFADMMLKSAYVPVKTTGFLSHKKVTFINIDNPICERLFRFRKYFNSSERL